MKCPFCGTYNQPGDSFCTNCGGYLDSSAAAPTIVSGSGNSTVVGSTAGNGSTTFGGSGGSGAPRTLTPNAQLQNGRYVVEKVLGQGGMGAAVLAKDSRVSNKLVVIKELVSDNTNTTQHQEDVRNFEREVETLATLDHPLVPTVTDSFQEGSHYFMVQEYASGENLEDHMERVKQPMDEREALSYTSQVLDILDYLEQQSPPIVHRDIKPANIIVGSKDHRARLVDFGIARAQANKNAKRKQTSALGTPGYAPPEQYQGNADERSDIYALAATLHHLLTNRDPRDYPPFAYPPVRTLNPKLTQDIERVLERALKLNVNERYQNAAAMKHDIDDILVRHFRSSGDMSSYTLRSSSGPMATQIAPPPPPPASRPGLAPATPIPINRAAQGSARPPAPPARGPSRQGQSGTYAGPPQPPTQIQQRRRGGSPVLRNFLLLVTVVLLIGAVLFFIPRLSSTGTGGGKGGATPIVPTTSNPTTNNPISVTQAGKELIGISDGSFAFDTDRADGTLKKQAADKFKNGDPGGAAALWSQAIAQDTNDAEVLIYLENQRIANFPHVTFVVGTMPSGDSSIVSVARADLQGAYVAQKEYNDNSKLPNGVKVRLLIASSGGQPANATKVAQQIVALSKADNTFVGVMGWPFTTLTSAVVSPLSAAGIPMVSSTASGDNLTGISPYFFRVAPPNKAQGAAGAQYAYETMGARNVAVFVDPGDPYSQSLASSFTQQFQAKGGAIAATVNYTVGNASSVQTGVQNALPKNPDLIYFAGHASDLSGLLQKLRSANVPTLKVLGGDALYELGNYPGVTGDDLNRLHLTAFAYPDQWSVLGLDAQKPAFFANYAAAFDPNKQHQGSPYGYTRPQNDAILSYDATIALLTASQSALKGQSTITPAEINKALATTAFQGVSGWISFQQNGDPANKAFVILYYSNGFKMEKVIGKFQQNS